MPLFYHSTEEVLVLAEHKDEQSKAVAQPAKVEARQSSEKNRQLELSDGDKAKEAAPPAAIAPVTRGVNVENGRGEGFLRQRYGLSPGQGGVVTGRADQLTEYAVVPSRQTAQRYAQERTYRLNFNSPPMPDVLNSFQVEQNGRQLRVVDADGSVYDGAIEAPVSGEATRRSVSLQMSAADLKKNAEEKLAGGAAASNLAAVPGVDRLVPQNILFRVAGTNRTLNQLVVFEGNILANMTQTNGVSPVAEWIADHPAANAPQRGTWLQRQPLPSGLIQGQATIGESNRIQINAAPVLRSE